MGQNTILTGMILSAVPIGEYDKRVILLTKERGRISAFAKGARKQNSQLLAAANPFAFGQFEVFEGRSSYSIYKASISNYFQELRLDLEGLSYGFYFLELANYYTRENIDELPMLKLLYQSLRALEKSSLDNRLVMCIFELKSGVINGVYPNVFSCISCGKKEELAWLSETENGTLCQDCGKHVGIIGAMPIDQPTLYAMQYIITSSIEKLYTFSVSDKVLVALERIMKGYREQYLDVSFHSLELIDGL